MTDSTDAHREALRNVRRVKLAAYRVQAAAGDEMAAFMARAVEAELYGYGDDEDDDEEEEAEP